MLNYKIIDNDNNEWVVFLHGFGGNLNTFKKQIDDYSTHYNLLFIDLNGHGESKIDSLYLKEVQNYEAVARDILKVLNFEKINDAHFMGISLGTMVIFALAKIAPNRINSMVLAGATVRFEWLAKLMFITGNLLKSLVPYITLYSIFALAMMPKKNHKISRTFFIDGAKKIGSNEFFAWFEMVQRFDKNFPFEFLTSINIPKLYLMGAEDHMFRPSAKEYAMIDKNATFAVVPNSGHVCNMDNTAEYNKLSLEFLENNSYLQNEKYKTSII